MTNKEERELKKKQERNEKCATEILEFILKNELGGDMSIYFNNKAFRFTSQTEYKTLDDVKGSTFFHYSNDDTVSMSFEGTFYEVMNRYVEGSNKLIEQFDKIIEKYGFYYELGNAWNLSLYEN